MDQSPHLTPERNIEELWSDYQDGKTQSVFAEAEQMLAQNPSAEQRADLHALKAWCCYQEKNFSGALEEALQAGQRHIKGLEVQAFLRAYEGSPFRDEQMLINLSKVLPEGNLSVLKAMIISARVDGSELEPERILSQGEKFIQDFDPQKASGSDTNLINNLSRLTQTIAEREGDSVMMNRAVVLMERAIEGYGKESNWAHRGAAFFHLSRMHESLGNSFEAFTAAEHSAWMWDEQYNIQPSELNKNRSEGAEKRARELQGKLSFR